MLVFLFKEIYRHFIDDTFSKSSQHRNFSRKNFTSNEKPRFLEYKNQSTGLLGKFCREVLIFFKKNHNNEKCGTATERNQKIRLPKKNWEFNK